MNLQGKANGRKVVVFGKVRNLQVQLQNKCEVAGVILLLCIILFLF